MAFDHRQLTEVRDAFARHGVRYLVIGKAGALLHGYPDTTQDVDVAAQGAKERLSKSWIG